MRPSRLLASLCMLYSSFCLVAAVWAFGQWNGSAPVAHAEVKGATTELSTGSTLSVYPSMDASLADTIRASHFALYNVESGKVVLGKGELEQVPIASTTKLMTAYVIDRIGNYDDIVTVSQEAASRPSDSSLMGVVTGEKLTVKDLMYGTMLVSGNDAAYALAEYGGGLLLGDESSSAEAKVARFVAEMNADAAALHMEDTRYMDSIGYDDEGRSTALDLAKLTAKVIESPTLTAIISTPITTVYSQSGTFRHDLRNSNRLVADYQYEGSIGGKTGFTPAAGHCLVSAASRDGKTFVAVILNTDYETNEASAVEARKLLDLGFTRTEWR